MIRTFSVFTILMALAAPATAGTLTYSYSGTFNLESGTDTLGLTTASVTFTMVIDDSETWKSLPAYPIFNYVDVLSHSVTITGASESGTDGTYSDPDGLIFADGPSGSSSTGFVQNPGDPSAVLMGFPTPNGFVEEFAAQFQGPGTTTGNTISAADFGTLFSGSFVSVDSDSATYDISITAGPTVVADPIPEPTSLLLLSLGSVAWLAHRRTL